MNRGDKGTNLWASIQLLASFQCLGKLRREKEKGRVLFRADVSIRSRFLMPCALRCVLIRERKPSIFIQTIIGLKEEEIERFFHSTCDVINDCFNI